MVLIAAPDTFKQAANEVLQNNPERAENEQKKDFDACFGSCPSTCACIWNMIEPETNVDPAAKPKHLGQPTIGVQTPISTQN